MLKIDLRNGTIEVEGEEAFVNAIYQDYKQRMSLEGANSSEPIVRPIGVKKVPIKTKQLKDGVSKGKRKESYQIVKELDLSPKAGKVSLRDFYKTKSPKSGLARNTVFVYYLEKVAKVKNIGANHIYSCYKDVNQKVPMALHQSLVDTGFKKGWLDTKSMTNITVTTQGENLVEHDLPGSKAK